MKTLVVGAGATGGFFGGKLVGAGRDVTFLLRGRRAQGIRERGLQIVDHHGQQLTVHPRILAADDLRQSRETFDLILLSTKAYGLEAAMDDIAPAVGPDTMLLPLLNGMRQFPLLDARFGADRVLGGSVRIVSDLDTDGRVLQMTPLEEMSYGERSRERTPRILAVDAVMAGAGFTAILQPDILATLWGKWWILAGMGAICVLARGTIGQAAEVPRGPQLALAILDECTAIAAANGYPADPDMLAQHRERYTERGSALTSSLYRDMMKGAPVEADHIFGDLLDYARSAAQNAVQNMAGSVARPVPTPLLTAAYVQLKVYEASRPQTP